MKISRTLNREILNGKEFPMDSIILYFENGAELVCSNFTRSRKQKLELFCYIPAEKKWVKMYAKNEYTEIMWDYHRKHQSKKCKLNCANLMNHDRVHKNGGGGSRISHSGIVTDYECKKEPLHDFRRSRYVQWN